MSTVFDRFQKEPLFTTIAIPCIPLEKKIAGPDGFFSFPE